MAPHLKISSCLVERLSTIRIESCGRLYGVMYNNSLLVLTVKAETSERQKIQYSDTSFYLSNLSTEVDYCGMVVFGEDEVTEKRAKEILMDVDVTDNPLLLNCKFGINNFIKAHFFIHGRMEEVKYEVMNDADIWKQFVHIRIQTRLPMTCLLNKQSLCEAMSALHKKLVSGQASFNFANTSVYLMGNDRESGLTGLAGDPLVGELCDFSAELSEGCLNNYSKKKSVKQMDILSVNLYWKPTHEFGIEDVVKHAPIINHNKKIFDCLNVSLKIDTLSMVHRQTKVINLYAVLVESLIRNLRQSEYSISSQIEAFNNDEEMDVSKLSLPEPYHFFPEECGHFITLSLAKNLSENDLKEIRKNTHNEFLLSLNRPYFRRSNRYLFKDEIGRTERKLINPHIGLNSSVKDGETALVKGKYTYYHYMQDDINDDGWGCAYRSFQTVFSWFRWQGYTEKPVPTHRDIQECLVNIGDKPRNFINSKQWIGSTEVGFCLESLLNVSSRYICVNSGEELATKGSELVSHFKIHGTPIMIGGGVLAHTILGVDFCKESGQIKFLILDPHYTGNEDLAYIQSKGWCGWKTIEFWKKGSFYNLCLPQVQKCY